MDPRVPDQPDHRLKVFPKPTTPEFEAQVEIFSFFFFPPPATAARERLPLLTLVHTKD